ncbi:uncharacterized protein MONBRDRAFT_32123 [Monosiga brevicollis MX1]|uniref:EGF-like domain-containing protein n=1 Tax=Monosiga brevicollis TaxID=81824 RepID=A9UXT1_MONBE|nr:uncharacterized protein MONBRDRAFT_32123 [Monosiga brevicollis MX1]EDQ89899.1 predicted protein [Monosiga brevicollis MX1]|eukprot:XP_001745321.1 hypothetical protein [Monosiga brevicollis MX1]
MRLAGRYGAVLSGLALGLLGLFLLHGLGAGPGMGLGEGRQQLEEIADAEQQRDLSERLLNTSSSTKIALLADTKISDGHLSQPQGDFHIEFHTLELLCGCLSKLQSRLRELERRVDHVVWLRQPAYAASFDACRFKVAAHLKHSITPWTYLVSDLAARHWPQTVSEVTLLRSAAVHATHHKLCVAFSDDGWLKSWVPPMYQLNRQPGAALYVADNLDLCGRGVHTCAHNARCIPQPVGSYSCECQAGFVGNGQSCLPVYGVSEQPASNFWDERRWRSRVATSRQGVLKKAVADPGTWVRFTNEEDQGMFVRDFDYCRYQGQGCPLQASCQQQGPGRWACTCDDPGADLVWVDPHKGNKLPYQVGARGAGVKGT